MPEHPLEPGVAGQLGDQPAFAAAEVDDRADLERRVAEGLQDGFEPLVVEPDGRLQDLFLGPGRLVRLGVLGHQERERLAGQRLLVAEVAMDDPVAMRVVGQPAFAVADQLVDLVDADEIVLRAVDHRGEDVEVAEEVADRLDALEA